MFRGTAVAAALLIGLAACGTQTGGTTAAPQDQAAAAVPAAARAATDPTALVNCATADGGDGLSQVASFQPPSSNLSSYDSPALTKIRSSGTMTVGTSGDVLLWGYRDPLDAQLKGFDIELLGKIAASLGAKVQYRVINYAQRIPSLGGTEGSKQVVDIVAHTMTVNCARWKQISFSTEYYNAGQRILVRFNPITSKPAFTSVDQMKGKDQKVCAATGSTNIDNIENISKEKDLGITTVAVDDLGDCLVKMQQGEVDAITGDDTVLAGFAAQDTYTQVQGGFFSAEPYGLGFNKRDKGFVEYVNVLLDKWRNDGTLAALGKKYMGEVASPVPDPVYGRENTVLAKATS